MYINVGMANCEKRPKQERDDIHFTHMLFSEITHWSRKMAGGMELITSLL